VKAKHSLGDHHQRKKRDKKALVKDARKVNPNNIKRAPKKLNVMHLFEPDAEDQDLPLDSHHDQDVNDAEKVNRWLLAFHPRDMVIVP
jgi:hypothetical protein